MARIARKERQLLKYAYPFLVKLIKSYKNNLDKMEVAYYSFGFVTSGVATHARII